MRNAIIVDRTMRATSSRTFDRRKQTLSTGAGRGLNTSHSHGTGKKKSDDVNDEKISETLDRLNKEETKFQNFWVGVTNIVESYRYQHRHRNHVIGGESDPIRRLHHSTRRKAVSAVSSQTDTFLPIAYSSQPSKDYLFHPYSTFRVLWDILLALLLLYSILSIPLRVGFDTEPTPQEEAVDDFIIVMFFLDIVVQANSTYLDPETETWVFDRKTIIKHYLKFWFWVDVLAAIPFDNIADDLQTSAATPSSSTMVQPTDGTMYIPTQDTSSSSSSHSRSNGQYLTIVRFIRAFRLIRIVKLYNFLQTIKNNSIQSTFGSSMSHTNLNNELKRNKSNKRKNKLKGLKNKSNKDSSLSGNKSIAGRIMELLSLHPTMLSLIRLGAQIFFIAHVFACFWHYIAIDGVIPPDMGTVTWIKEFGYTDRSVTMRYVASLYYVVVTMLTIGYGDIYATNDVERVYAIVTMIVGGVIFGALVAQVAQAIDKRNPQQQMFNKKMYELKLFMADVGVPLELRDKAKSAYAYYLQKKSSYQETSIYEKLPPFLLNDLVRELYKKDIDKITIFQKLFSNPSNTKSSLSVSCSTIVVHLMIHSRPCQVQAHDYIFREGDVCHDIAFIKEGNVRIDSDDVMIKVKPKRTILTTATRSLSFFGKLRQSLGLDPMEDSQQSNSKSRGHAGKILTGYLTQGDMFGDVELYQNTTTALVSYQAITYTQLLFVSHTAVKEAIEKDGVTLTGGAFANESANSPSGNISGFSRHSGSGRISAPTTPRKVRSQGTSHTNDNLGYKIDGWLKQRSHNLMSVIKTRATFKTLKEVVEDKTIDLQNREELQAIVDQEEEDIEGEGELLHRFHGHHHSTSHSHDYTQTHSDSHDGNGEDHPFIDGIDRELSTATTLSNVDREKYRKDALRTKIKQIIYYNGELNDLYESSFNIDLLAPKHVNAKTVRVLIDPPVEDDENPITDEIDEEIEIIQRMKRYGSVISLVSFHSGKNKRNKKTKRRQSLLEPQQQGKSVKQLTDANTTKPEKIVVDWFDWQLGEKWLLHPEGKFKLTWDFFIASLILYSVLIIPVELAFQDRAFVNSNTVNLYISLFFLLDIILSFRTCYTDPERDALIVSTIEIIKNYMKLWFWIDFVSTVPWDDFFELIIIASSSSSSSSSTDSIYPTYSPTMAPTMLGSIGGGPQPPPGTPASISTLAMNAMTSVVSVVLSNTTNPPIIGQPVAPSGGGSSGGSSTASQFDKTINQLQIAQIVKVVRMIRLIRVLRAFKLKMYLEKLEDRLGLSPVVFELLAMLIQVFFIIHLTSCIWWGLTDVAYTNVEIEGDVPWYSDALSFPSNASDASIAEKYLLTIYFTFATMSTVGYGDLHPNAIITEQLLGCLLVVLGASTFGYMIANVSSLLSASSGSSGTAAGVSGSAASLALAEELNEIAEYLQEKQCSITLRRKILNYCYRQYAEVASSYDIDQMTNCLPPCLKVDILYTVYMKKISKIPIFTHLPNRSVVIYLFQRLTPAFFECDHCIIREGDVAKELIFLVNGTARAFHRDSLFELKHAYDSDDDSDDDSDEDRYHDEHGVCCEEERQVLRKEKERRNKKREALIRLRIRRDKLRELIDPYAYMMEIEEVCHSPTNRRRTKKTSRKKTKHHHNHGSSSGKHHVSSKGGSFRGSKKQFSGMSVRQRSTGSESAYTPPSTTVSDNVPTDRPPIDTTVVFPPPLTITIAPPMGRSTGSMRSQRSTSYIALMEALHEEEGEDDVSEESYHDTNSQHSADSKHSTDSKHSGGSKPSDDSKHSDDSDHSTDSNRPGIARRSSLLLSSPGSRYNLHRSMSSLGTVNHDIIVGIGENTLPGSSHEHFVTESKSDDDISDMSIFSHLEQSPSPLSPSGIPRPPLSPNKPPVPPSLLPPRPEPVEVRDIGRTDQSTAIGNSGTGSSLTISTSEKIKTLTSNLSFVSFSPTFRSPSNSLHSMSQRMKSMVSFFVPRNTSDDDDSDDNDSDDDSDSNDYGDEGEYSLELSDDDSSDTISDAITDTLGISASGSMDDESTDGRMRSLRGIFSSGSHAMHSLQAIFPRAISTAFTFTPQDINRQSSNVPATPASTPIGRPLSTRQPELSEVYKEDSTLAMDGIELIGHSHDVTESHHDSHPSPHRSPSPIPHTSPHSPHTHKVKNQHAKPNTTDTTTKIDRDKKHNNIKNKDKSKNKNKLTIPRSFDRLNEEHFADAGYRLLGDISPGDFIGHVAFMSCMPHDATVRCLMPTTVYSLAKSDMSELIRKEARVGIQLQSAIARAVVAQSTEVGRYHMRRNRARFLQSLKLEYRNKRKIRRNTENLMEEELKPSQRRGSATQKAPTQDTATTTTGTIQGTITVQDDDEDYGEVITTAPVRRTSLLETLSLSNTLAKIDDTLANLDVPGVVSSKSKRHDPKKVRRMFSDQKVWYDSEEEEEKQIERENEERKLKKVRDRSHSSQLLPIHRRRSWQFWKRQPSQPVPSTVETVHEHIHDGENHSSIPHTTEHSTESSKPASPGSSSSKKRSNTTTNIAVRRSNSMSAIMSHNSIHSITSIHDDTHHTRIGGHGTPCKLTCSTGLTRGISSTTTISTFNTATYVELSTASSRAKQLIRIAKERENELIHGREKRDSGTRKRLQLLLAKRKKHEHGHHHSHEHTPSHSHTHSGEGHHHRSHTNSTVNPQGEGLTDEQLLARCTQPRRVSRLRSLRRSDVLNEDRGEDDALDIGVIGLELVGGRMRSQSYPSLENELWKEQYIYQGVV